MPEIKKPDTKQLIKAELHRGMPDAKVQFDDKSLWIKLEPGDDPDQLGAATQIMITLEKIDVKLHDQSYGMISASTGCYSNPGGPGC
jgi:hypothetical protein